MRHHVSCFTSVDLFKWLPLRCHVRPTNNMVLVLHVWGPAFGLPSIEPECIATVAYCQRVIPEGQWSLIANFDTTVGTTGTRCLRILACKPDMLIGSLPILFDDDIATATGFEDIVAYLRNHPEVTEDIDGALTAQQLNDKTASVHASAVQCVDQSS
jgi:hypothetical protein